MGEEKDREKERKKERKSERDRESRELKVKGCKESRILGSDALVLAITNSQLHGSKLLANMDILFFCICFQSSELGCEV